MNVKAKVNLGAVKAFHLVTKDVEEYSKQFTRGTDCLMAFYDNLKAMGKKASEKIAVIRESQKRLSEKIKNIEGIIAELTSKWNELKNTVTALETELMAIKPFYTMKNREGEEHEEPNPKYINLENHISKLKSDIEVIESEIQAQRQRLNRANNVDSQLTKHIDSFNVIICSLEEKSNNCKRLTREFENLKTSVSRKTVEANENLKKIEQVVSSYKKIKMDYNQSDVSLVPSTGNILGNGDININVDSNRTTVVNVLNNGEDAIYQNSVIDEKEIEEHQIKFDDDYHICEYEGRKYGGCYNSYEERINRTSKDDPIRGFYNGDRGESKYIPSNRSAEGIVVINILKEYGLDGIEYRSGEPDFEVCSVAVVTIANMSENRENYYVDGTYFLGNFSQADMELAKLWNYEKREGRRDWTPRDVFEYRQSNGYTWHEKCDTKTMVLVKAEINDYFRHLGGCSECRVRDNAGREGGGFDE